MLRKLIETKMDFNLFSFFRTLISIGIILKHNDSTGFASFHTPAPTPREPRGRWHPNWKRLSCTYSRSQFEVESVSVSFSATLACMVNNQLRKSLCTKTWQLNSLFQDETEQHTDKEMFVINFSFVFFFSFQVKGHNSKRSWNLFLGRKLETNTQKY